MDPAIIGELIPIIAILAIVGAVVLRNYNRSQERMQMQQTIRAAIEKGQPLPPDLVDVISREARPAPSAARDLRAGIIWLGIAAGLIGMGYALGYTEDAGDAFWPFMGLACIPGFIGAAYLIVAAFNRSKGNA